jgi:predicted NBD/HSP70 family sugar kinase
VDPEKTRGINRATVLDAVFTGDHPTRASLSRVTGLSAATVSRVVEELLVDGALTEGELIPASGRGRPTSTIELAPDLGCVMGLDMGLSSTTSAFVDLQGRTLGEDRSLVSILTGGKSMVGKAAERIARMRDAHDIAVPLVALTISVPAVVTEASEVLATADGANLDKVGDGLCKGLEDALGVPVGLINDARAALLGETLRGAAVGCQNAALLMLSTAVGVAALIDGELLSQRSPNSRSYGCVPFDDGRLGDYLSSRGLCAALPKLNTRSPDYAVIYREPSLAPLAKHFLDAAVLLAITTTIAYDAEVIVFTGRLSDLTRVALPDITARVEEILSHPPRLVISDMRGRAGALGAAHRAVVVARTRLKADITARRA